jgi:hypothetical protein
MSRSRNLADTISGNYDFPQGYVTADSTDTFTNKSGNNSQWTNDASYATTTAVTTATANSSNWDTAYGWGNHASAGYLTSFTEADTLDSVTGRGASTTNNITVGNLTCTTGNITTVDLGNWTVTESAGVLYFATGGVNKMKLDASGNLTVVGNVTAYGTM